MGIYWRYKHNPGGFRSLVELLESTPMNRRKRMIEVGLAEDSGYTNAALKYVLNFNDIISLPDMELAEVLAKVPGRTIAFAIKNLGEDIRERFLRNATPQIAAETRDMFEAKPSSRDINGAQLKLITTARDLERQGYIKTKKIPTANLAA
jgi:flagellar motor switch protein FliG